MNSNYNIDTSYGYSVADVSGLGIIIMLLMLLISTALCVLMIISMWKIFKKNNKPGWACLIPIYNVYTICNIVGKKWWFMLLFCLPIANIYALFVVCKGLAEKEGKNTGFVIGMMLLPVVFFPILAFSKNREQLTEQTSNLTEDSNISPSSQQIQGEIAQPFAQDTLVNQQQTVTPVAPIQSDIPSSSVVQSDINVNTIPVSPTTIESNPVNITEPIINEQPVIGQQVISAQPVMPQPELYASQVENKPVNIAEQPVISQPVVDMQPVMPQPETFNPTINTAPTFEQSPIVQQAVPTIQNEGLSANEQVSNNMGQSIEAQTTISGEPKTSYFTTQQQQNPTPTTNTVVESPETLDINNM